MEIYKVEPGLNEVHLVGEIAIKPEFIGVDHGAYIYEGAANVARLSGVVDAVPFVCDGIKADAVAVGDLVTIKGLVRQLDRRFYASSKNRMIVEASALWHGSVDFEDHNKVELSGFLCKEPNFRVTPFGREVCEIIIAVPRENRKQDYIVCIAWGGQARRAKEFSVGARLHAYGRFQSRVYTKRHDDGTSSEHLTYEISLFSVREI